MHVKTLIDFEGLQKGLPITPKGTILDLPEPEALHYVGLGLMEPAPQALQDNISPQPPASKPQPENPPAAKGSGKKTHS